MLLVGAGFALAGVTLYTMIVGTPPFMAENEFKLVEMVKSTEIRIPTDTLMDPHLRYACLLCAHAEWFVWTLCVLVLQKFAIAHGCKVP